MDEQIVIQTDNLTKVYNDQAVVDGLNLSIREGEIFGFLGPNGAGKTTTLLMLLGMTQPTSGSARVLGYDPMRNPIEIKSKVGYLQENMGFYSDLNAVQMLSFIAELNNLSSHETDARIAEALDLVGLSPEARKKISTFSRGMRQRLGIAELLIKNASVAFLDEPTLGLDPDATNRMIDLISRLVHDQRMTVLLSSHLLYQVQQICHRVGIMIKGKMVAQGKMEELANEKLGVGSEKHTLEELYMKYFQEAAS